MTTEAANDPIAALPAPEAAHLRRLVASSAMLADVSFADILVLVPRDEAATGFLVAGQRRPINAQTIHPADLVGEFLPGSERPLSVHAFETGEVTDGGLFLAATGRWVRTLAVPIRFRGKVIGVLVREFSPVSQRIPGELEMTYFAVFRRLAAMVAEGIYPFPAEGREHEHMPRVGDGLILLDVDTVVEYISPNALSALRRAGIAGDPTARRISAGGLDDLVVRTALHSRLPHTEEILRDDYTLVLRAVPLIAGDRVTGAVLLARDISELRRRDRLIMTKDATIAEIHHRVKNNLQTISSLLRLQSRRAQAPEAKAAIAESVRRIRSISVVHELLSREPSDEVPFAEVVHSLVRVVQDALIGPERPVRITIGGEPGVFPSDVTTTLAVVVSELLQNAMDHAFPPSPGDAAVDRSVTITLGTEESGLRVEVADNGVGLPPTADGTRDDGLGLTIVRTLVETELGGTLELTSSPDGTTAVAIVPRR
ncbi:MAG: sensor histidine kinase [Acidimicrobiales bacterium]